MQVWKKRNPTLKKEHQQQNWGATATVICMCSNLQQQHEWNWPPQPTYLVSVTRLAIMGKLSHDAGQLNKVYKREKEKPQKPKKKEKQKKARTGKPQKGKERNMMNNGKSTSFRKWKSGLDIGLTIYNTKHIRRRCLGKALDIQWTPNSGGYRPQILQHTKWIMDFKYFYQ